MRNSLKLFLGLSAAILLGAAGCDDNAPDHTANQHEASAENRALEQIHRNQPVHFPAWSMDRMVVGKMFDARQAGVVTFSVVQSEYTGKVLWSCPSIGFPVPYSTQITNPHAVEKITLGAGTEAGAPHTDAVVLDQAEPNGLYPPATSDATWVPCVDGKGNLTPVYEEKHVTVFLHPVEERGGTLVGTGVASLSINPNEGRP